MSRKHTEAKLEEAIEHCLIAQHDYHKGESKDFDPVPALEPARMTAFLKATQTKTWKSLQDTHGGTTEKIVLEALAKELAIKGMLKVLRHGFKCYGKKLKIAFFAPNNQLNPESWALYGKNVLSVTRQLHYSDKHGKSLDMV